MVLQSDQNSGRESLEIEVVVMALFGRPRDLLLTVGDISRTVCGGNSGGRVDVSFDGSCGSDSSTVDGSGGSGGAGGTCESSCVAESWKI